MEYRDYKIPIKDSEIIRQVEVLRNQKLVKGCHLFEEYHNNYPNITIGDVVNIEVNEKRYGYEAIDRPAMAILRVILSAHNNYNKVVRARMESLKEKTNLNSFNDLERIVNSLSKEEFLNYWNYQSDKKYYVLVDMLTAINKLREISLDFETDYALMNSWAEKVEIDNLKNDIFGGIYNVAEATVQHLRMNFGVDTIKPDLQVIRVLEREFGIKVNKVKAIKYIEYISRITKYKMVELDQIFVNYGSGYYVSEDNSTDKMRKSMTKFNIKESKNKKKISINKVDDNYMMNFEERFENDKPYDVEYFFSCINKNIVLESRIYRKLIILAENIQSINNEMFKNKENDIKIIKRKGGGFIFELVYRVEKSEEIGKNVMTLWLKSDDFDIDIRKRTNGREPGSHYDVDKIVIMFKERLKGISTSKNNIITSK